MYMNIYISDQGFDSTNSSVVLHTYTPPHSLSPFLKDKKTKQTQETHAQYHTKTQKGILSIQIKYQNKLPKQSKMKQMSTEIILSSFVLVNYSRVWCKWRQTFSFVLTVQSQIIIHKLNINCRMFRL